MLDFSVRLGYEVVKEGIILDYTILLLKPILELKDLLLDRGD